MSILKLYLTQRAVGGIMSRLGEGGAIVAGKGSRCECTERMRTAGGIEKPPEGGDAILAEKQGRCQLGSLGCCEFQVSFFHRRDLRIPSHNFPIWEQPHLRPF